MSREKQLLSILKTMKTAHFSIILATTIPLVLIHNGCLTNGGPEKSAEAIKTEKEFSQYARPLEDKLARLYTDMQIASWAAAISGKDEDFKTEEVKEKLWNEFLANKEVFATLKKYHDSGLIKDPLLCRESYGLYLQFLGNQVDPAKLNRMTEMQSDLTKHFQNFRAKVGDKVLTDNDVEEILTKSHDSKELEATWKAQKEIGTLVADDIIKLVKLRNEVAKELGFKHYHDMSLRLSDEDPEEVSKLFDELDTLTHDSFKSLKQEIDHVLSAQDNIKPDEMMPWHYQNRFFQEAPKIYDLDLDQYYKDKDVVKLMTNYYAGIGFDIAAIVAKSDLFEKPGKNQHGFETDIDRKHNDIRVLCNVRSNDYWMGTLLHEFGHANYTKYQDHQELPWILDQPAAIFTTEGMAMLFERFATSPKWMLDMKVITKEEMVRITPAAQKILRLRQLVFSRWAQVMYRFEKSLYENPDQDLNKLWWDIVEKYQMIKRPANRNLPDWATKIHIVTDPCYYHNYLMGDMFASQMYCYVSEKVMKNPPGTISSFANNKDAGRFFIEKIFKPGSRWFWNDMIERATGEKLTAKYYARQFVQER